jgi:hypothetical protein
MPFREMVSVYRDNLMKHINTLCGQSTAFNLKSHGSYSDCIACKDIVFLHSEISHLQWKDVYLLIHSGKIVFIVLRSLCYLHKTDTL